MSCCLIICNPFEVHNKTCRENICCHLLKHSLFICKWTCTLKVTFYIFSLRNFLRNHMYWHQSPRSGIHKSQVTEFCLVAPNMCACWVWNLLYVIPVPRILRWLLDFLKTCAPLHQALMLIWWFLCNNKEMGTQLGHSSSLFII
jgi:hypothetical protein